MRVKGFDTEENKIFWGAYHGSYHGDKYSRPLVNLVRKYVGSRVLDAGAGSGSLVRVLEQDTQVAEVIGVDIAPKSEAVLEGDITNLPFPDEHFDTIFCVEVIEHVSAEVSRQILTEFNRVLAPKGYLIVTTPFAEELDDNTVRCPSCQTVFHRWGHQQSFTLQDLERMARDHGLLIKHNIPVKMTRLARFGRLGVLFFRSKLYLKFPFKGSGKLKLILVAQKPQGDCPTA